MNIGNLFFMFSGRINRAKYWLAVLVYVIINVVLFAVGYALGPSITFHALNSMLAIVILISSIAVGIKRLHDRNKSGWYMLLFYLAPGVLAAISAGVTVSDGSGMVATILMLVAIAVGIWAFVELGCLRGTIGGNQYGPDPIAPEILTPPVHTH